MPFTFSHPAIILPLRHLSKKWFSLTGLIIGSLIPDFEYFIRMRVQSNYSHTLKGIFWFDLPLALLFSFAFHNYIKSELFKNLPNIIRSRILIYSQFKWNNYFRKNWIVVITSILIGIVSHIFWDSFTHEHGYFVDKLLFLKEPLFFFNHEIPLFKITQHLSSLIGGILILLTILKLPKSSSPLPAINAKYWVILIFFTVTITLTRILISLNFNAYGHIIVSAISAFLISLILTPLFTNQKSDL